METTYGIEVLRMLREIGVSKRIVIITRRGWVFHWFVLFPFEHFLIYFPDIYSILEVDRDVFFALERASAGEHCAFFYSLGDGDAPSTIIISIANFMNGIHKMLRRKASQGEPSGYILLRC